MLSKRPAVLVFMVLLVAPLVGFASPAHRYACTATVDKTNRHHLVLTQHGGRVTSLVYTSDDPNEYLCHMPARVGDKQSSWSAYGPLQLVSIPDPAGGGYMSVVALIRRPHIGHWVMAVGRTNDDKSWKIYDPGDTGKGSRSLASAYGGVYAAVREYKRTKSTYDFPLNQFNVSLYCPAELLVTNPAGKRTGYDPLTKKSYNEIPNALYDIEGLDNDVTGAVDPDPTKLFTSGAGAPQGTYKLQVTGTGTGTYTLETTRIGVDGGTLGVAKIADVPIIKGEVNTYSVDYSTSSTNHIVFRGGFCGRSNSPEVNKFLCYGNPGQATTMLPAGTMKFRLMISYGPTTSADTFSAQLDGEDITSLFNPAPGKTETVYVPLPETSSRNTLVLSISGTKSSGRTATDTDRLVFLTK